MSVVKYKDTDGNWKVQPAIMNKYGTLVDNYSDDEIVVGKYKNGKPIYRKVVEFGALPNKTTKSVNHNIDDIDEIVKYSAIAQNDGYSVSLPVMYPMTAGVSVYIYNDRIQVYSNADYSSYAKTTFTIDYTKTTDDEYIMEPSINMEVPTGTIISFMGTKAPLGYFVCDGSEHDISNYSTFAKYLKDQFGSVNYFGGDGENTFAVPDLRGEFLRGSGENSHENQGNGGNVGEHQNATEIPNVYPTNAGFVGLKPASNQNGVWTETDSKAETSRYYAAVTATAKSDTSSAMRYMTRPTNTSVLYCIKY